MYKMLNKANIIFNIIKLVWMVEKKKKITNKIKTNKQ